MHHGQNRGKRKRNLAKIRKLCGNSKGKRMNFAEMGKICKLSDLYEEQEIGEIWNMHNWLRVGDGRLWLVSLSIAHPTYSQRKSTFTDYHFLRKRPPYKERAR